MSDFLMPIAGGLLYLLLAPILGGLLSGMRPHHLRPYAAKKGATPPAALL